MNERTFKPSDAYMLEDPDRLNWLPPMDVIGKLGLTPDTEIADIGAGTGYFAIPMARQAGRVFAVDLQADMLDLLAAKLVRDESIDNIDLFQGTATATTLGDQCCDRVFLANVWHELDDQDAVLAEARRILRPGGQIAILDWRPDGVWPPGPPTDHRIPAERVQSKLTAAGWNVNAVAHIGRYHYLLIAGSS
jgi:ubiquinone/menaquinone biosynthesis C-methylase UbiE